MNKVVLDSSAILALLFREPGAEFLTLSVMSKSVASTVNLAEVQARLVRAGVPPEEAWVDTLAVTRDVEPFHLQHAKIAGSLIDQTRPLGLSLGDRACLALAISLGASVYTADAAWKGLNLGIPIHLIR